MKKSDDDERRGGRTYNPGPSDAVLHHATGRDPRTGDLAIVSAEDLFFCEGHMQEGRTFLSLVRSWKSGDHARLPFKNELIRLGGGKAPGSHHFEQRFAEANSEWMRRLFGKEVSADEVLAEMRLRPAEA